MKKVELEIIALTESKQSLDHFVLVLEDKIEQRRLPITIGRFEAQAIAIAMQNIKTPRPMTHDLMVNFIAQTDIRVNSIMISAIENDNYHARICFDKIEHLDARPSDAVALALRTRCPIYIFEDLLNANAVFPDRIKEPFLPEQMDYSKYTLAELEKLLKDFLNMERYERASEVRDAIKRRR